MNDRVRDELAILGDRGIKVELDTLVSGDRIEKYMQQKLASELIKL